MLFACCVLWQVFDWHHRCAEYSEPHRVDVSGHQNPIVHGRLLVMATEPENWRLSLPNVPMVQCSNVPSCIPPRLAPARCPVPITPSSQVATHVSTQTSVIASCFHWDQAWPWHNAWQVAVPQFPCVFKMPVKSAKQPIITAKRLWFHRSLRCGQLDLVTPARHLDSLVPGDEQRP